MMRSGWLGMAAAAMMCTLLPLGSAVSAQQTKSEAKVKTQLDVLAERPGAVYKAGETVNFRISLQEDGRPVTGQELTYAITGDGNFRRSGKITTGDKPVVVSAKLDRPGFLLCRVNGKTAAGKNVHGDGGAAVDPLKLKAAEPVPADFDAFWARAKAELDQVPIKAKLIPVEVKDKRVKGKVECFDVKIDCAGGMPVSGYLCKPVGAKKGSLPIVVSYHGAGVRSSNMPLARAAKGALALDINAHGLENGKPAEFYKDLANGGLKDYRTRDSNDPQKIYFRGMYLRLMRSLEYMKSLPEWDGRILVVTGTSQGGGQSLVAAGVDPQVTCCVAYVPALCYHIGVLHGENSGWPRFIRLKNGKPENPDVVKTVPYYDAANFASRIKKADCMLSTGFIDTTCAPTSVYMAFNGIPSSSKVIVNDVTSTHRVPRETYVAGDKFIDAHIRKMQQQK